MDLLRRQLPDADVASFRFKAVRPTFDLHPFRSAGPCRTTAGASPVGPGPRGLADDGRHRDVR
jgi:hypothetical protein